ncbi:MAG: glycosyltransferase family 4 protein, partial [Bryobacteraceae bacterium]
LYTGRLAQEKNIPLLIETLEQLPETYFLLIAGEGSMKAWLEETGQTRAHGRLRFLGHLRDRDELGDLYANADAFLHPNPREPFGIAPLEAMASGLPVIAPNAGGVLTYANEANAWLARPFAADLAQAVMQVFADTDGREGRTIAARRTAEEHSWPIVAGRFFDLFDELARNASCEPALTPA